MITSEENVPRPQGDDTRRNALHSGCSEAKNAHHAHFEGAGCGSVHAGESAHDRPHPSREWVFKPNRSLTPKQLLAWYLSLVVVSTVIATAFAAHGLWFVLPFAGVELALVACAFLLYARHTTDYERVVLTPLALRIETASAANVRVYEFNPRWTRFEFKMDTRMPLFFRQSNQAIHIGRFLDPRQRYKVAREIRESFLRLAG